MIVIFQRNRVNSVASVFLKEDLTEKACYYPHVQFSKENNDNRLILLDLTADGQFQSQFGQTAAFEGISHLLGDTHFRQQLNNDSELADVINAWDLPDSIKTIDLYVSEVKSGSSYDSLFNIASHLASSLKNMYGRQITVRIPSDSHYDYTLIVPPEKEKKDFEIYGILRSDFHEASNFDNFLSVKNKTLIWKGQKLDEWFAHPSRQFSTDETTFNKRKLDTHIDSNKKMKSSSVYSGTQADNGLVSKRLLQANGVFKEKQEEIGTQGTLVESSTIINEKENTFFP